MIWLLACATHQPMEGAAVRGYERELAAWTREERRYNGVETVLLVRATLDSPEWVRLREEQRAWLLQIPEKERGEAEQKAVEEAESQWRFTLAVTTDRDRRPTLSTATPPWLVRLTVGDRPCTLRSMQEREPTELDIALYPWISPWLNIWELSFDRDCGQGSPRLQVVGPTAAAALVW
jgi:hypothetical protein